VSVSTTILISVLKCLSISTLVSMDLRAGKVNCFGHSGSHKKGTPFFVSLTLVLIISKYPLINFQWKLLNLKKARTL